MTWKLAIKKGPPIIKFYINIQVCSAKSSALEVQFFLVLLASLSALRQLILCVAPLLIAFWNLSILMEVSYKTSKQQYSMERTGKTLETVLNDLRTMLQNCAVIGHTLLERITVWTPMRLFSLEIGVEQFRSVTKIAPKLPVLSVNKCPVLDLSSLIFVAAQKPFSVVWTVNLA